MKRKKFAFVIHNHQPVGNFDFSFRQAYERAYEPFLYFLKKFPLFKTTLHISGPLLDWLWAHKPDYFTLLKELVSREQIELLAGGYYEPVLTVIPHEDILEQIGKHIEVLEREFGTRPKGLWLAERVWEPSLVGPIAQAGIEYVVLDDTHFEFAGIEQEKLSTFFITEDQGKRLKVFASSSRLRREMPFLPVENVLRAIREAPFPLVVVADDGEKFGDWPGTEHSYVPAPQSRHGEGWLYEFASELEAAYDEIEPVTLGQYAATGESGGLVYIPPSSYREMTEWSLPLNDLVYLEEMKKRARGPLQNLLKGGLFRNFLIKYPEANLMHKKMLVVRDMVRAMPESKIKSRAREAVLKAQCNCPYWHGVFGGIYLPHLRNAIWNNLLEAEALATCNSPSSDRNTGHMSSSSSSPFPAFNTPVSNSISPDSCGSDVSITEADEDADGHKELRLKNRNLTLSFAPRKGGVLREFSFFDARYNLSNTMTRRPELYHPSLKLSQKPIYDWYEKHSFIDHFFDPHSSLQDFEKGDWGEQGDFVMAPYSVLFENGVPVMKRKGHVIIDGCFMDVTVKKSISLNDSSFDVEYTVSTPSSREFEIIFAPELNLSFPPGKPPDRYFIMETENQDRALTSRGEIPSLTRTGIVDRWLGFSLLLDCNRPFELWRTPVYTISRSLEGAEYVFQQTTLLMRYREKIAVDKPLVFRIRSSIVR